jgi:hypothetical protein
MLERGPTQSDPSIPRLHGSTAKTPSNSRNSCRLYPEEMITAESARRIGTDSPRTFADLNVKARTVLATELLTGESALARLDHS